MNSSEALRRGIKLVRSNPALLLVEVAWRWLFGFAVLIACLGAAPIVRDGYLLAITQVGPPSYADPEQAAYITLMIASAVLPYIIKAAVVLALAWVICATVGRVAVLRALAARSSVLPLAPTKHLYLSMSALNAIRVLLLLIPYCGYVGGLIIGRLFAADTTDTAHLLFGVAIVLIVLGVSLALWVVASFVASLATIIAVTNTGGPLDALVVAIELSRRYRRDFIAVSATNATVRTFSAAVVLVLSLFATPFVKSGSGVVVAALIATALTIVYCIISDALLLARTAAFFELIRPAAAASASTDQ